MSNLSEFQKQYSSDKAVWWYTRDTFFFKTLNAVLRTENIHMIFLFRAYIADIQNQLKTHQVKGSVRVYRGQLISRDELKILQNSFGQFISVNSFFSTSTEDEQARLFINVSSIAENLEPALFEIIADSKAAATKPFADIRSLSEFSSESEILFMIGSIFRLNSINRSSNGKLWIIRMTLCSENDSDLKNVLTYMKLQLGEGETSLRTLGKVLWKMGRLDLSEFYLTRLLNDLPPKHPLLGDLYEDLAEIAGLRQNYDKSIEYQQKALEHKVPSGLIDKKYIGEGLKQAGK
jgi:tetratricopeptide (TPR) repeat protein